MEPVECRACGSRVQARKSSWDQTTVQWSADALLRCQERQAPGPPSGRPNRDAFPGCGELKASLRAAAVRGSLTVQDGDPFRTNPEEQP